MRKLIVLALLAPLLGGCFLDPINNPLNTASLYDIEAGYLTAEQIAIAYLHLPLCRTGTQPSLTNQCGKRSVDLVIQDKGRKAQLAILALRSFVRNNPTISPINALTIAQNAIADFQFAVSATQRTTP